MASSRRTESKLAWLVGRFAGWARLQRGRKAGAGGGEGAELRIKAQLFATHADQPLPQSEFESPYDSGAVRRYSDASALGSILRSDEFVPVAVHDGFHTFERGDIDDVDTTELADELKAAFFTATSVRS